MICSYLANGHSFISAIIRRNGSHDSYLYAIYKLQKFQFALWRVKWQQKTRIQWIMYTCYKKILCTLLNNHFVESIRKMNWDVRLYLSAH